MSIGVLYDIGCHLAYKKSKCISLLWVVDQEIEQGVFQRNLIPHHEGRPIFETSVFHAYVHEWPCQIKYNPRFNRKWGLSDGEGLERLWSFLSLLVAPGRVSTRLHRLLAIHLRADVYVIKKIEGSGEF